MPSAACWASSAPPSSPKCSISSTARRDKLWGDYTKRINDELFDQAPGEFNWYCLEELRKNAQDQQLWAGAKDLAGDEPALKKLRAQLDPPFQRRLLLWRKDKPDIVQEMNSAMQMPGWGNIWTQPIINRIDMLATGIRTMIGVKVFGNDLKQDPGSLKTSCRRIE